ncbi:MAG: DUF3524 domain-containing protein [Anaerolineae bacterium]|nr:DUF3524 domain-containing protein [Anaerolineae bacterium]
MLAADAVWFNSQFHLESWFTAVPTFLKHFPEYNELGSVETLRRKSRVLPVGVDFARLEDREIDANLSISQSPSLPSSSYLVEPTLGV